MRKLAIVTMAALGLGALAAAPADARPGFHGGYGGGYAGRGYGRGIGTGAAVGLGIAGLAAGAATAGAYGYGYGQRPVYYDEYDDDRVYRRRPYGYGY